MISQDQARKRAASMALEAVRQIQPAAWIPNSEDSLPIALELARIVHWLINQAAGNDAQLARQMARELDRQTRDESIRAARLRLATEPG